MTQALNFEQIRANYLRDLQNQNPAAHVHAGSDNHVRATAIAAVGEGQYQHQEWILRQAFWRWCVDIADGKATAYIFRAGQSRAGDRISVYTDPIIETMFEELKPAWTYCRFEYEEEV